VVSVGERSEEVTFSFSGLTSVTIPNGVTTIEDEAFFGGNRLRNAYLAGGAGTYMRSSSRSRTWKKQ
jgi:hypothetical protein